MPLLNSGLLRSRLIPGGTDPNFNNVLALLHYNGNFNDVKGNTVTPFNSPTINNSVVKHGGGAGDFNGTNCIQILSSAFVFDTDFTLETWLYRKDSNQGIIFNLATSNTNGRVQCGIDSDNRLFVEGFLLGLIIYSTNTVPTNQWIHVAFSRVSGTLKAFINGIEEGTAPSTETYGTGEGITIASFDTSTGFIKAYFDETRITDNVGRYTANFTPPSSAFPDS